MDAALLDPDAIIKFMTDGIFSKRELKGLPNVLADGEPKLLGAWELKIESGLITVQSGFYSTPSKTMTRGVCAANLRGASDKREWMLSSIIPLWQREWDGVAPVLEQPYTNYVTAGSASASEDRWNLCGWWLDGVRNIDVHNPGRVKRTLDGKAGGDGKVAFAQFCETISRRATEFIRTYPKRNEQKGFSKPRAPDWLDDELGAYTEIERETNEILLAKGGVD